jgi:plastocyanin
MSRFSSVFLLGWWIAAMCWPLTCWADPISVRVVDASGQPLPDAVVSVDGLAQGPVKSGATLDQRDLSFVPRVLAVRKGGSVRFINGDQVNHHVYSFSPVQRFDLRLKRGDDGESIGFERAGTVVIGCNIHDWMLGFIRVVDSDYFAVTDADGQSALDVPRPWPEGAILRVWHPQIAETEGEVLGKLAPQVVITVAKELKPNPWPKTPDYR